MTGHGESSTGPAIPQKPYHNKVGVYNPRSYDKIREYNHVHEYKKAHQYNHAHEHKYTEYKPTHQNEYKPNKPSVKKTERSTLAAQPPPPRQVRPRKKNHNGDSLICYGNPMGPDIKVKEYKVKQYQASDYRPTYREYRPIAGPYMDRKQTVYSGSGKYILTPNNHYPYKWGWHNVDVHGTDVIKEKTQTSLSKVEPIVHQDQTEEKTLGADPAVATGATALAAKSNESQEEIVNAASPPEVQSAPPPVVAAAPAVAAVAVAASSGPNVFSQVPTQTSRLPPEVVANIQAYNQVHAVQVSSLATVKRTLNLLG